MLSKSSGDEVLATRGEGNDPNAPVVGALDPADQILREETVYSDTDRTWGQVDDRAYRINGQGPLYLDTFVKADGAWLFPERLLHVDWMDERPLS